jgi:hypothetical protein
MRVSQRAVVVVITMVAAMVFGCATTPGSLSSGTAATKGGPTAEEEIRATLEDYHAAMMEGEAERAAAVLSDESGNKAQILKSLGLLEKSEISLKECKITVKGSTAIAKPVIYETPFGRSVQEYRLQKERDGVWRIIISEKITAKTSAKKAPTVTKNDIWSAASEGNLAGIKRHIAAGADLGALDPMSGNTPLQWSIFFGQLEASRLLVEAGVDVNAESRDGSTALHTSAYFGPIEVVKLLLEHGADTHVPDQYYRTPLDIVEGPWDSKLEGVYRYLEGVLKLKLDLERIKAARPAIADLLLQHD